MSKKGKITKRIAVIMASGAMIAGLLSVVPQGMASAASSGSQNMYRLYNPNSGEHFYTANVDEKNALSAAGWKYEGLGWVAPAVSDTPVYRLYNGSKTAGDHHYTMDAAEKDMLISRGWKDEGIGWYSDDAKGLPLYRQYNPKAATGTHNYTLSKGENDGLVNQGWRAEGISWYGLSNSQEAVDQEKNNIEKAEAAKQSGSLGFFESVNATKAVEALKGAQYASYTKFGDSKDATSLDNMMKSLDFIDECNSLRARHGLSALKVTDYMMAVAQSNTNASATLMNHSRQFSVGENLAWGYSDPFKGWYDEEKAKYDAGNQNFGEVGHYLNIINSSYNVTGFAMNQYGSYRVTHGQTFSSYSDDQAYSVAEYRARVAAYMDSMR